MVEVYSTNVKEHKQADILLDALCKTFPAYEINFDLDDCDNILRVKHDSGTIEVLEIISLMNNLGFTAQALPDNI